MMLRKSVLVGAALVVSSCYGGRAVNPSEGAAQVGGAAQLGGGAGQVGGNGTQTPNSRGPVIVPSPGGIAVQYIEGDLGHVTQFTSSQVEVSSVTASSMRFDVESSSPQYWVMGVMNFNPPLSDPRWSPGTTITSEGYTRVGDAPHATLLGCSGPRRPNYTYDRSARRVTIHVEEGPAPGTRMVNFTAYWDETPNGPQAVSGSFVYAPN